MPPTISSVRFGAIQITVIIVIIVRGEWMVVEVQPFIFVRAKIIIIVKILNVNKVDRGGLYRFLFE